MRPGIQKRFVIIACAGLALGAIALFGVSRAQGQQQQGGQGGGFGGGQGGFGGAPGQRGGPGGPGSASPRFLQGKISAGDAAAGTITMEYPAGMPHTIKITPNTTMTARETILLRDLRIGDEVQVQGIPTGISATTITAGTPPAFLMGGRRRIGPPPGAAQQQGQLDGNGNPVPQGPPPANAMANGKVVSTSPVTISVGENMDIVLKLGHDAKVTRYANVPFGNLKVGDTIIVLGTPTPDGNFEASSIGVNMSLGGEAAFAPGRRGPGGPGGLPGGPGGGFPGGGGQ